MKESRKESGFTIVEVLIAIVILLVGVLAVISMFTASMKAGQLGRDVTVANRLAQKLMEQVKTQTFDKVITKMCTADTDLSNCAPFVPSSPASVGGCSGTSLRRGRTADFTQPSGGISSIKYRVQLEEVQDYPVCGLSIITVTVTWKDASGSHATKIITYMQKA